MNMGNLLSYPVGPRLPEDSADPRRTSVNKRCKYRKWLIGGARSLWMVRVSGGWGRQARAIRYPHRPRMISCLLSISEIKVDLHRCRRVLAKMSSDQGAKSAHVDSQIGPATDAQFFNALKRHFFCGSVKTLNLF